MGPKGWTWVGQGGQQAPFPAELSHLPKKSDALHPPASSVWSLQEVVVWYERLWQSGLDK